MRLSMIRKPKSAWEHILALIQDGYLTHAESVVLAEEAQIDELHKELIKNQTELNNATAQIKNQTEIIASMQKELDRLRYETSQI